MNYGVQGKAGCKAKGPGRAFRGFDLHRRILKVDEASESNNENDVHKVFEHHFILSHLPPVLGMSWITINVITIFKFYFDLFVFNARWERLMPKENRFVLKISSNAKKLCPW